jgi:hypothetical protein
MRRKSREEIELEMERNFSAVAMVTIFDYLSTIDIHQSIQKKKKKKSFVLVTLLDATGSGREKETGGYRPTKRKKEIGRMDGKKKRRRGPLWSRCAICLLTLRDWARHGSHEYNQEDFVSSYYYYSFFEFPKMKNGGTTENSFRSR